MVGLLRKLVIAIIAAAVFLVVGQDFALNAKNQLTARELKLIASINKRYYDLRSVAGDFIQIAPDGDRSQGKIYLKKPGKIRFYYHKPSRLDIISNGWDVVVKNRGDDTQDRYSLRDTPLYDLLADRSNLIEPSRIEELFSDDTFVTVVLAQQTGVGDGQLVLIFGADDLDLRQWAVVDPEGRETSVALYNLRKGVSIADKLFKIERVVIRKDQER